MQTVSLCKLQKVHSFSRKIFQTVHVLPRRIFIFTAQFGRIKRQVHGIRPNDKPDRRRDAKTDFLRLQIYSGTERLCVRGHRPTSFRDYELSLIHI